MIQLMRFVFQRDSLVRKKLSHHVAFLPTLDLTSYTQDTIDSTPEHQSPSNIPSNAPSSNPRPDSPRPRYTSRSAQNYDFYHNDYTSATFQSSYGGPERLLSEAELKRK